MPGLPPLRFFLALEFLAVPLGVEALLFSVLRKRGWNFLNFWKILMLVPHPSPISQANSLVCNLLPEYAGEAS